MTDKIKDRLEKKAKQNFNIRSMLLNAVFWVLVLVASFILSQLLVYLILRTIVTMGIVWDVGSAISVLIIRLVIYIVMVGLIALALWYRQRKLSLTDAGIKRWLDWGDIGLSLAGFMAYMVLVVVVLTGSSLLFGLDVNQAQDLGFTSLFGSDLLIAFIVLVVLTPLFEEVIFRGVLYGKLRSIKIPWWVASLIVSVLFGLAHMQWNVGLDVFCLSMVACVLRERTGNIWAGVLLHITKNFIAYIVTFTTLGKYIGL